MKHNKINLTILIIAGTFIICCVITLCSFIRLSVVINDNESTKPSIVNDENDAFISPKNSSIIQMIGTQQQEDEVQQKQQNRRQRRKRKRQNNLNTQENRTQQLNNEKQNNIEKRKQRQQNFNKQKQQNLGKQKRQVKIQFLNPLWEKHYNETEGKAVKYARLHKIDYRYSGYPPSTLDIIENNLCLKDTTNITTMNKSALPFGILIGVEKGGTTALAQYLHTHPDIVRTRKELHILDDQIDQHMLYQYKNFISIKNRLTLLKNNTLLGIPSRPNVQNLYGRKFQLYSKWSQTNNSKLVLDMTPFYMFLSDRIPQRIICIVPNAKVFAMLRNPIERTMSHYEMIVNMKVKKNNKTNNGNKVLSFDEFVKADIAALKETGVIQDWDKVNFNTYFGSKQEYNSWRIYINSGVNNIVGMGLYSIQIKHLLNTFDLNNKSRNDFLAIRNEDLKINTNNTYLKVLNFLNLSPIPLKEYILSNTAEQRIERKKLNNKPRPIMSNETKQLLYDTFEPYNRQLVNLLGNDWDGIWT